MKRKLLFFILSCPIMLFGQNSLTKFLEEGRVGYKSSRGKIKIEAKYDYGSDFTDGSAIIVIDGKRGLIDENGLYLIPPIFEDLTSFSDGVAAALKDGKYGFVNKEGDWLLTPQYDEVYSFSEKFARVKSGAYYGFVNSDLELVIPAIYFKASDFKRGKTAVQMVAGGTYSYIRPDGELAFEGLFEMAYAFHTKVSKVRLCGKWYEIDEEGIIIGEIEERHEEY